MGCGLGARGERETGRERERERERREGEKVFRDVEMNLRRARRTNLVLRLLCFSLLGQGHLGLSTDRAGPLLDPRLSRALSLASHLEVLLVWLFVVRIIEARNQ